MEEVSESDSDSYDKNESYINVPLCRLLKRLIIFQLILCALSSSIGKEISQRFHFVKSNLYRVYVIKK